MQKISHPAGSDCSRLKLARVLAAMLVLPAGLLFMTGCVTSKKYKMAKDDTPPAKLLQWSEATPAAQLTLETLIVFKGPGSWKREARWDEYVVGITNPGSAPLVINSAALVDILGQEQNPGTEPWALEKLSYTNWEKYGKTGLKLVAGAGVVALYVGAAYGVAMAGLSGGAAAGGAVAVLGAIPIIAVIDISAVAIMNHNNKRAVMAEFERRRLHLPLTIAPGATVTGSWFFPMTPGPRRLIMRGQSGGQPGQVALDLKPLAALHLAPQKK